MRGLDNSRPVSPERWEGGRPQRARHMSAVRSGTEMSPCPRGYRSPARDASRCHDVVVVSGVVVRGSGRLGSSAARRKPPSPLETEQGRRAASGGGITAVAARHRALLPQSPARPSLLPISILCTRKGVVRRVSAPSSCPHHLLLSLLLSSPFTVHPHPHPHHPQSEQTPAAPCPVWRALTAAAE